MVPRSAGRAGRTAWERLREVLSDGAACSSGGVVARDFASNLEMGGELCVYVFPTCSAA